MERNCSNCGQTLIGKYCHACGQRDHGPADKSLKAIGEETFHFLTHFDGSFPVTLRAVLFNPGKLTSDYCAGIRKKYYKPVSFFLVLIVLYLLFPVYKGLNMAAESYRALPLSGRLLNWQLDRLMALRGWDSGELARHFGHVSEKVSKILLLLLIPLTALILRRFKRKVSAYDLLIAATEINIVVLLFMFFISVIALYAVNLFTPVSAFDENLVLSLVSAVAVSYIWMIIFRFCGGPWWKNTLRTLVFVALYTFAIQIVYKFILFQAIYMFL